jgi:hypothetical protein
LFYLHYTSNLFLHPPVPAFHPPKHQFKVRWQRSEQCGICQAICLPEFIANNPFLLFCFIFSLGWNILVSIVKPGKDSFSNRLSKWNSGGKVNL